MLKMWDEIWEQPIVLGRCYEKNADTIKKLVDKIKEHNVSSVCIAARGTSDHAAVYGKYVLELTLGIPVSLAASSVFTIYQKSLKLKDTLVIGISQSGKAADVLEVLKDAKKQGAITVSITNAPDSPLAEEAMFHLNCAAEVEKSVAATKTFTAEMYLLAQLVAEWLGDDKMKEQILTIPKNLSHVFEIANTIEEKVERYRFMDECFVLARGVNYAVSLEAALKIQETTYVRAKAFATSDFQHGPIAMIDADIPVIIFAPDGPTLKDLTEMARKLKQDDVELIMISNKKELLEMGTCSFRIPETDNDIISPFFNVVVAQMFACKLAVTKGLDPDNPRRLKKVTITK